MQSIVKKIRRRFSKKELLPLGITSLLSIVVVSFLHLMGTFDFLEFKMYDFKFNVRDDLYGVDREDLDVVIVYSDDESYKLLNEKFSYPFPRGKVWAKAIENLSELGAKVIVLDYMFDAPDLTTTEHKIARDDMLKGKYSSLEEKKQLEQDLPVDDNDQLLYDAIISVKEKRGTNVILSGKVQQDPNSTQLYSILYPSSTIGNIAPPKEYCAEEYCSNQNFLNKRSCEAAGYDWIFYETQKECEKAEYEWIEEPYEGVPFGLIDIAQDSDGFLRKYIAYQKLPNTKYYNYSLAIVAGLKFYEEDHVFLKPKYDESTRTTQIGDNIVIDTYGGKSSFLLNYHGPSSAADGISGTFKNYSLKSILDGNDICLGNCLEGEVFTDLNGNGECDNCIPPDVLHDTNWNDILDPGEKYDDNNGNGIYDPPPDLFIPDEDDDNSNGVWDEGEYFEDYNQNEIYDAPPLKESFIDYNCNGKWDFDVLVPSSINQADDDWFDMYTNSCHELYSVFGPKMSPFKDKIVILGTSIDEEQDVKSVPLMETDAGSFLMPGVDVHANAIQQIIDNSYIESSYNELEINSYNWVHHIGLIIVLVTITLLIVTPFDTFGSTISMVLLLLFWFYFSVSQFTDGFWIFKYIIANEKAIRPALDISNIIPTIFPMISIIIPYGLNLSYKLYTEGKNKKFLKDTFGTFVSPKLVDQMYESKQTPQLGGIDVYNTCFFSDIASFSSFSEKMTAPELVVLLNEYLEEMTNILLDNGGTLDKYIGDAIIAIFGSPIEIKDHEYRGVLSICQMNEKLEELRIKWKSEGDKWPEVVHNMRHRIGLNTGQIVAGNMGSSVRMSYTMMGDAVNTTARLESGAKQYGIESQVGEEIYEATKDKFIYRHLDHVRVKGKKNPVKTFELISEKGKEPDVYKKLIPLWDKAVSLYKKQKWDEAISLFEECDKLEEVYIGRPTNPSLFFIARCNEFKANPPEKDWDGIYTLKSK